MPVKKIVVIVVIIMMCKKLSKLHTVVLFHINVHEYISTTLTIKKTSEALFIPCHQ